MEMCSEFGVPHGILGKVLRMVVETFNLAQLRRLIFRLCASRVDHAQVVPLLYRGKKIGADGDFAVEMRLGVWDFGNVLQRLEDEYFLGVWLECCMLGVGDCGCFSHVFFSFFFCFASTLLRCM